MEPAPGQDPQPRHPRSSQGIALREQPLCTLPVADPHLTSSFNLPDFISKPSVLIIPLSAKLKSSLIPGSFLPGKVLAHCNQVTSQATFH